MAFPPIKRLALIGDSNTDRGLGGASYLTALTASGGVMTVTGNALSETVGAASTRWLSGITPLAYNMRASVMMLGSQQASIQAAVPDGTGSPLTGSSADSSCMYLRDPQLVMGNFVGWACTDKRPDIVAVSALVGMVPVLARTRLPADVLPYNPTHAHVLFGALDVKNGVSVQSMYTNTTGLCDDLRAQGIAVLLGSALPLGATNTSTNYSPRAAELNALLQAYAAGKDDVLYIDYYSVLVDPADTYKRGLAAYYADTLYVNEYGRRVMGNVLAPVFAQYVASDLLTGLPNTIPNNNFSTTTAATGGFVPAGAACSLNSGTISETSVTDGVWKIVVNAAAGSTLSINPPTEAVTLYDKDVTIYHGFSIRCDKAVTVSAVVFNRWNNTSQVYKGLTANLILPPGDWFRAVTLGHDISAGNSFRVTGAVTTVKFATADTYVVEFKNPLSVVRPMAAEPAHSWELALAAAPSTLSIGAASQLTATLTDNGSPAQGQRVDFALAAGGTGSGTLSAAYADTDANGKATVTLSGVSSGSVTVRATLGADAGITRDTSLTIRAPGPSPEPGSGSLTWSKPAWNTPSWSKPALDTFTWKSS